MSSLEDYARSGKYLKWTETNFHNISLAIPYEEFTKLKPVFSDRHESEQYEIPIVCFPVGSDSYDSILATKSKTLLVKLLEIWRERDDIIIRLAKEGTGFYTKWRIEQSNKYYDRVSGKVKNLPAKKL